MASPISSRSSGSLGPLALEYTSAGHTPGLVVQLLGLMAVLFRVPVLLLFVAVSTWAATYGTSNGPIVPVAVLVVAAGALVVWRWRHPASFARLVGRPVVGSWRREFVYRASWDAGMVACGLAVRPWTAHQTVPVLGRLKRTPRGDVLVVRMLPGQTLAAWIGAGDQLAQTFNSPVCRVAPVPGRPQLVRLTFTRGDELAGTRVAQHQRSVSGSIVLGRAEDGTSIVFDVFDAWHTAMQGATRSGKTATSCGMLAGYADHAAVLVCGLDPSGILLAPWLHGRGGGWIATGTADMPAHAAAINAVVEHMDTRIRGLVRDGVDKLDRFTPAVPLVWVVLEEYPGLLVAARMDDDANGRKGAERVAPQIERAVGRLVKEGAKVGVRLLVLAQRMSANALDTDDRSNFGARITLRVDNADALRMLHDSTNLAGLAEQARQYPAGMGLIETPDRPLTTWRADYLDYATYRTRVLDGIAATNTPGAFHAPRPLPPSPPASTGAAGSAGSWTPTVLTQADTGTDAQDTPTSDHKAATGAPDGYPAPRARSPRRTGTQRAPARRAHLDSPSVTVTTPPTPPDPHHNTTGRRHPS